MLVCVGKWKLLPKSWDGINSLYSKTGKQIIKEAERQERLSKPGEKHAADDRFIGIFTLQEFEEEFNGYLDDGHEMMNALDYWIKFVDDDGNPVLNQEERDWIESCI